MVPCVAGCLLDAPLERRRGVFRFLRRGRCRHAEERDVFHARLEEKLGSDRLRVEMRLLHSAYEAWLHGMDCWDQPRIIAAAVNAVDALDRTALEGWRYWSVDDPAIHYAVYRYATLDALQSRNDANRRALMAEYEAAWPGVTRTREILLRDATRLEQRCLDRHRATTSRCLDHASVVKVDDTFVVTELGYDTQHSRLSAQVEQLKDVVDAQLLERPFDRHGSGRVRVEDVLQVERRAGVDARALRERPRPQFIRASPPGASGTTSRTGFAAGSGGNSCVFASPLAFQPPMAFSRASCVSLSVMSPTQITVARSGRTFAR